MTNWAESCNNFIRKWASKHSECFSYKILSSYGSGGGSSIIDGKLPAPVSGKYVVTVILTEVGQEVTNFQDLPFFTSHAKVMDIGQNPPVEIPPIAVGSGKVAAKYTVTLNKKQKIYSRKLLVSR